MPVQLRPRPSSKTDSIVEQIKKYLFKKNPNLIEYLLKSLLTTTSKPPEEWANEFKNVFKHLNPPHKLCVSFRSYKPHRFDLIKKLGNKNLSDLYIFPLFQIASLFFFHQKYLLQLYLYSPRLLEF